MVKRTAPGDAGRDEKEERREEETNTIEGPPETAEEDTAESSGGPSASSDPLPTVDEEMAPAARAVEGSGSPSETSTSSETADVDADRGAGGPRIDPAELGDDQRDTTTRPPESSGAAGSPPPSGPGPDVAGPRGEEGAPEEFTDFAHRDLDSVDAEQGAETSDGRVGGAASDVEQDALDALEWTDDPRDVRVTSEEQDDGSIQLTTELTDRGEVALTQSHRKQIVDETEGIDHVGDIKAERTDAGIDFSLTEAGERNFNDFFSRAHGGDDDSGVAPAPGGDPGKIMPDEEFMAPAARPTPLDVAGGDLAGPDTARETSMLDSLQESRNSVPFTQADRELIEAELDERKRAALGGSLLEPAEDAGTAASVVSGAHGVWRHTPGGTLFGEAAERLFETEAGQEKIANTHERLAGVENWWAENVESRYDTDAATTPDDVEAPPPNPAMPATTLMTDRVHDFQVESGGEIAKAADPGRIGRDVLNLAEGLHRTGQFLEEEGPKGAQTLLDLGKKTPGVAREAAHVAKENPRDAAVVGMGVAGTAAIGGVAWRGTRLGARGAMRATQRLTPDTDLADDAIRAGESTSSLRDRAPDVRLRRDPDAPVLEIDPMLKKQIRDRLETPSSNSPLGRPLPDDIGEAGLIERTSSAANRLVRANDDGPMRRSDISGRPLPDDIGEAGLIERTSSAANRLARANDDGPMRRSDISGRPLPDDIGEAGLIEWTSTAANRLARANTRPMRRSDVFGRPLTEEFGEKAIMQRAADGLGRFARANDDGPLGSAGVFGRPLPDDVGAKGLTRRIETSLERLGRVNDGPEMTSADVFGRPLPDDVGATALSQRAAQGLDRSLPAGIRPQALLDRVELPKFDFGTDRPPMQSSDVFGRPLPKDVGATPLSQRAAAALDSPLPDPSRAKDVSRRIRSGLKGVARANDGPPMESSDVFGRPLPKDIGEEALSQRVARGLDAPLPDGSFAAGVSQRVGASLSRLADMNEGTPTRSSDVFGRPLPADLGEAGLAERTSSVANRLARANDDGPLGSADVFGRPLPPDVDAKGAGGRLADASEYSLFIGAFKREKPGTNIDFGDFDLEGEFRLGKFDDDDPDSTPFTSTDDDGRSDTSGGSDPRTTPSSGGGGQMQMTRQKLQELEPDQKPRRELVDETKPKKDLSDAGRGGGLGGFALGGVVGASALSREFDESVTGPELDTPAGELGDISATGIGEGIRGAQSGLGDLAPSATGIGQEQPLGTSKRTDTALATDQATRTVQRGRSRGPPRPRILGAKLRPGSYPEESSPSNSGFFQKQYEFEVAKPAEVAFGGEFSSDSRGVFSGFGGEGSESGGMLSGFFGDSKNSDSRGLEDLGGGLDDPDGLGFGGLDDLEFGFSESDDFGLDSTW